MKYHLFGHLKIVTIHRYRVFINCCHLGIPLQGLVHDLSKFNPQEFLPSAKYYQGNSSPIFAQRKNENLYSSICVHHTNHNKHHFEYWIDIYRGDLLLKAMPFKYVLEYLADVISASETYNKKNYNKNMPFEYFSNRYKYYLMNEGTINCLLELFKIYSETGFKHLHKKETKIIYKKYHDLYPDVELVKVKSLNNN